MPTSELLRRLNLLDVQAGDFFRHTRSGEQYVVKAVALEEATRTPVVVYEGMRSIGLLWTRPAAEFLERFMLDRYNCGCTPPGFCKTCDPTLGGQST